MTTKKYAQINKVPMLTDPLVYTPDKLAKHDNLIKANLLKGIPPRIVFHDFDIIPESLIAQLFKYYRFGSELVFLGHNGISKKLVCPKPEAYYAYSFEYLDLDHIPSYLLHPVPFYNTAPQHSPYSKVLPRTLDIRRFKRIKRQGYYTQADSDYIDQLSTALIARVKQHNSINYPKYNLFQKRLVILADEFGDALDFDITNMRNILEARAEQCYYETLGNVPALTPKEEMYLQHYGPMFGITPRPMYQSMRMRNTDNGYTEEPIISYTADQSQLFYSSYRSDKDDPCAFNRNSSESTYTPGFVKYNAILKPIESNKNIRESLEILKCIVGHVKHNPECIKSYLAPGYDVCPVCSKVYKEIDGCPDHVDPIEIIRSNNLFYSECESYDDLQLEDFGDIPSYTEHLDPFGNPDDTEELDDIDQFYKQLMRYTPHNTTPRPELVKLPELDYHDYSEKHRVPDIRIKAPKPDSMYKKHCEYTKFGSIEVCTKVSVTVKMK